MSKGKILWMSDAPTTNSGYATITRYILNGLTKLGWDCTCIGHNYMGQPLPPGTQVDEHRLDFKTLGNGREAYNKDIIESRIRDEKPDIFFMLLDTFMLYPWLTEKNLRPATTGFYFPSDGGGFPLGCEQILSFVDKPIAMAKYGQAQVKEDFGIDAGYIPHAIDTALYHPVGEKEKKGIREELVVRSVNGTELKGFLANKYVVGVVARNQGRKMLDRTVRSFAHFCKDKPDAVLYFHSDLFDAAAPFDLRALIAKCGVENRVCFSPIAYYENYPLKKMNDVYNAMDVFLLTTSGEGFGIPTIEAMACEVPVIVTDYTTTKELVVDNGQTGIAVPIVTEIMGNWNVYRGIMDEDKASEALSLLYKDRALAGKYGVMGRQKVLRDYDWKKVILEWDKLFTKIMKERNA